MHLRLKPAVSFLIAKRSKVKVCAQLDIEEDVIPHLGQVDVVLILHIMPIDPCVTAQSVSILRVPSSPFRNRSLFLVAWRFTNV
jgi:hypothetical protein